MFLRSLTHYFLYSSVRSRSAKTSIDIKTSQCCGVFFKISLPSNAKVATALQLFCQNIVCVGAAKELRTDYGGSYRHVERLRRMALGREVRYR